VVHASNADESGVVSGSVTDVGGFAAADVEVTAFPAGTLVGAATAPAASTFSATSTLLDAPEGL
jgi:hypothetical protein